MGGMNWKPVSISRWGLIADWRSSLGDGYDTMLRRWVLLCLIIL